MLTKFFVLVIVGGRNTEGTLDEVILFNLNNRNVIKTRLDSPVIRFKFYSPLILI